MPDPAKSDGGTSPSKLDVDWRQTPRGGFANTAYGVLRAVVSRLAPMTERTVDGIEHEHTSTII